MAQVDWDALARVIDVFSAEEYTPILHQFYPWLVDRLDDRDLEPETLVDFGCGTGLFAEKLAEWYPDADLVLVDDNAAMLARAGERLRDCERVELVQASVERALAGMAPESVDAMIFCRSWYALPEPDKLAARAMEALAPDGLVFLFDFTRPIDVAQMDEFYQELEPQRWPDCRQMIVDFAEGIAEGRYRVYSEPQIAAQWRAAGAELVAYESHEPQFPNFRACFEKA
jgi:ubiquinone/menaquinone biosynthesis C-methylase UbiE